MSHLPAQEDQPPFYLATVYDNADDALWYDTFVSIDSAVDRHQKAMTDPRASYSAIYRCTIRKGRPGEAAERLDHILIDGFYEVDELGTRTWISAEVVSANSPIDDVNPLEEA